MISTLLIFFLTILILNSIGTACLSNPYVTLEAAAVYCKDLHFDHAWYPIDAAAIGCILCTVLCVPHTYTVFVPLLGSDHRIFLELRRIFCRDLPCRIPRYPDRSAWGCHCHGLQSSADIRIHSVPTDGQTCTASGHERNHYIGQRYFIGVCTGIYRNVYLGKTDRSFSNLTAAAVYRGVFYASLTS